MDGNINIANKLKGVIGNTMFVKSDICKKIECIGNNKILWKDSMHISFCVDKEYIKYAAIFMMSIIDHNRENLIVFHIFCDDVYSDDKYKLNKMNKEFKNIELNLYYIDNNYLKGLSDYVSVWNLSIYYKAIAPYILYNQIDRLLYLDVDMCCVGKIDELFYTDLDNKIAGVVPDLIGYEKYEKDNLKRINCPNHLRYFNSGMILFDVNKFNENEICKKFFSTLETKKIY